MQLRSEEQSSRMMKSLLMCKAVFNFIRYISKIIQDVKKRFIQKLHKNILYKFYNKITSIHLRQQYF